MEVKMDLTLHLIAIFGSLSLLVLIDGCPSECICRSNAAHCESLGLIQFPVNVPPEFLHLLASNNAIREIPEKALANNSQMRSIYLHDNSISVLHPNTFRSLHNLQYLDLGGNNLTNISDRVFSSLNQLTFLNLTRNRISTIQPDAFKGLKSLSELYLSHNQLYNLHSGTFLSLANLNNLKLRSNNLRNVPNRIFRRLNKLTHLDLSYNRLRRITSERTVGLGKLRRLELQGNHIAVLDYRILPPDATCKQLKEDTEERSTRGGCLVMMPELRFVNLSGNDLSRLTHSSFSTLTKLVSLSLTDNRWRCDCYLKWVLERLRRDHGNDAVPHDQIRCWFPERFRLVSIEQLNMDDLEPFTNYSHYPDLQHRQREEWKISLKPKLNDDKGAFTTEIVLARRLTTSPFPANLTATSASRVDLSASQLPSSPALWSLSTTQLPDSGPAKTSYVTSHVETSPNSETESATAGAAKVDVIRSDQNGTDISQLDTFEDSPLHPPKQQDEMISWLLGLAIFVAVCVAFICGGLALRRQKSGGSGCGCCADREERSQPCSGESIRSFTNFPLLYENPLARRPLPRQPLAVGHNIRHGTSTMTNRSVDIRWTCGGSFGIGEETPSVPPRQRSLVPGRFISRLSSSCPPPVVPPRDPVDISWNDRDDIIQRDRDLPRRPRNNAARDLDNDEAMLFVTGASSYTDVRAGERRRHRSSPRKSHRRSLQIDERRRVREEGFSITPTRYHVDRWQADPVSVSAPVSRNPSGRHGRSSRRSKRDRDVSQALGILREIETSRDHGESRQTPMQLVVKRESSGKSHTTPECTSARVFQESLGNSCVLGSVAPRRVRRGASARLNGERPIEYFYHSRKTRKSDCESRGGDRVARSVSLRQRQSSNADEIDFEFPPPPPCAHNCNEDSPADTLSVSEASYELELPPPPPTEATFETPTSHSDMYEDGNQACDDYSELALCSSGDPAGNSRSERQFKSALHRRMDSVDSMHASRDTNCESLSNSDESSAGSSFRGDRNALPARYDYSEVRYRHPVDRLGPSRADYRRSMPAFNPSVYNALASGVGLGGSASNALGSDGYIYRSVNRHRSDDVETHFPMNRISRLDLSLSDSEWENSVKRDRRCDKASQRSSAGSTDTIIPNKPDAKEETRQKLAKNQDRNKQERPPSVSSQGTESVSSIEFDSTRVANGKGAYQPVFPKRSEKNSQVGIVPSILIHPSDSSDDVRRLAFNAADLKRLCVDMTESSTDDVSTDIEMFDLGTM